MIVSSVEQAVARARVLNQASVKIPGASLYSDSRGDVLVERLDATDWVVSYHNKRYEVLTDEQGCMQAATLPEFGVVIERRAEFDARKYPLGAPYGAPPDGTYRAEEVSIRAPQGEFGRDSVYFSRGEPLHVARSNWAFEWMGTAARFSDFAASARRPGALGHGEARNGKPPVGFSNNHCFPRKT
jgi:hypothetical protein